MMLRSGGGRITHSANLLNLKRGKKSLGIMYRLSTLDSILNTVYVHLHKNLEINTRTSNELHITSFTSPTPGQPFSVMAEGQPDHDSLISEFVSLAGVTPQVVIFLMAPCQIRSFKLT